MFKDDDIQMEFQSATRMIVRRNRQRPPHMSAKAAMPLERAALAGQLRAAYTVLEAAEEEAEQRKADASWQKRKQAANRIRLVRP